MKEERKSLTREIRIAPSDLALIEKRCKALGTNFSAFVRKIAIEAAKQKT